MSKFCIFNIKKACDDCGECNICDLDSNKTCTNCGKCLETPRKDYRELLIDEINDLEEDYIEEQLEDKSSETETLVEEGVLDADYIDDISGLNELISTPENDLLEEIYPGFWAYKKKKEGLN